MSLRSHLSSAPSSDSSAVRRCVRIILLSREELTIFVEGKARVQDVFKQVCEHLNLRETDYFGLAQQTDGEYRFLDVEVKLQKLVPKGWKSRHDHSYDPQPLTTFFFRVQYYVDHISLLKERTTRHQYYLQLRDNLLHHSQVVSEEQCFLLASFALQTDQGNYKDQRHTLNYFDPREYFPAWVLEKRPESYIFRNMPGLHRDLHGSSKMKSSMLFIREVSLPPIAHNLHFYRLKKRKADKLCSLWLGICPKGIEIHEDHNGSKYLLSEFPWSEVGKLHFEKDKFEIKMSGGTRGSPKGRKFTYYTGSDGRSQFLLHLCRNTHMFQLSMQPKIAEMRLLEEADKNYREMYIYSENTPETSMENDSYSVHGSHPSPHSSVSRAGSSRMPLPLPTGGHIYNLGQTAGSTKRISCVSDSSSNTTSGIVTDRMHASLDESEAEDAVDEIMIDSPPVAYPPHPSRPLSVHYPANLTSLLLTPPRISGTSRSSSNRSQQSQHSAHNYPPFATSTPIRPQFIQPVDTSYQAMKFPPQLIVASRNIQPGAPNRVPQSAGQTHYMRDLDEVGAAAPENYSNIEFAAEIGAAPLSDVDCGVMSQVLTTSAPVAVAVSKPVYPPPNDNMAITTESTPVSQSIVSAGSNHQMKMRMGVASHPAQHILAAQTATPKQLPVYGDWHTERPTSQIITHHQLPHSQDYLAQNAMAAESTSQPNLSQLGTVYHANIEVDDASVHMLPSNPPHREPIPPRPIKQNVAQNKTNSSAHHYENVQTIQAYCEAQRGKVEPTNTGHAQQLQQLNQQPAALQMYAPGHQLQPENGDFFAMQQNEAQGYEHHINSHPVLPVRALHNQQDIQANLQNQIGMQAQVQKQHELQAQLQSQHDMQAQLQSQHDMQAQLQNQHDLQTQLQNQHDLQTQLQNQHDLQTQLQNQHDLQTQLKKQHELQAQLQSQNDLQVQHQNKHEFQTQLRNQHELQSQVPNQHDMQAHHQNQHDLQAHHQNQHDMQAQLLNQHDMQAQLQNQHDMQAQLQNQHDMQAQLQNQHELQAQLQNQHELQNQHDMQAQLQSQHDMQAQLQSQHDMQAQLQSQHDMQAQLQSQHDMQAKLQSQHDMQAQLQSQHDIQAQLQSQHDMQAQLQNQHELQEELQGMHTQSHNQEQNLPVQYNLQSHIQADYQDLAFPALDREQVQMLISQGGSQSEKARLYAHLRSLLESQIPPEPQPPANLQMPTRNFGSGDDVHQSQFVPEPPSAPTGHQFQSNGLQQVEYVNPNEQSHFLQKQSDIQAQMQANENKQAELQAQIDTLLEYLPQTQPQSNPLQGASSMPLLPQPEAIQALPQSETNGRDQYQAFDMMAQQNTNPAELIQPPPGYHQDFNNQKNSLVDCHSTQPPPLVPPRKASLEEFRQPGYHTGIEDLTADFIPRERAESHHLSGDTNKTLSSQRGNAASLDNLFASQQLLHLQLGQDSNDTITHSPQKRVLSPSLSNPTLSQLGADDSSILQQSRVSRSESTKTPRELTELSTKMPNPKCPKHGIQHNIIEQVHRGLSTDNLGSSTPMLAALVKDVALLNQCCCFESGDDSLKRRSYAPASQATTWNDPGTKQRPMSWHSQNFQLDQSIRSYNEQTLAHQVQRLTLNGINHRDSSSDGLGDTDSIDMPIGAGMPLNGGPISYYPTKLTSGGISQHNNEPMTQNAGVGVA